MFGQDSKSSIPAIYWLHKENIILVKLTNFSKSFGTFKSLVLHGGFTHLNDLESRNNLLFDLRGHHFIGFQYIMISATMEALLFPILKTEMCHVKLLYLGSKSVSQLCLLQKSVATIQCHMVRVRQWLGLVWVRIFWWVWLRFTIRFIYIHFLYV